MEAPNNLPAQSTSFTGREEQIVGVVQLLAAARVLTLTGAGGCGKTRPALREARRERLPTSGALRALPWLR